MTTTDKRGFRLPWGGETRKPDDEADGGPGSAAAAVLSPATDLAPSIAPSLGTSAGAGSMLRRGQIDDLGRGPFDLAPADEPGGDVAESLVDVVEPTRKPAPAPEPAVEPGAAPEPSAHAKPAASTAWPDVDRRDSPTHLASDAPPPPLRPAVIVEGGPRKVNPLVAGLVKAMRDAARAARDETTARMRADAAARAEEIRLEAVAAGVALKKHADEDVTGIREWSRAEAARIKQEAETRIAERKARLGTESQAHATATEHLNGELKATIAAFEAEMDHFFDVLLKEDDPARLATLAERLPEPPVFARLGETAAKAAARAPRAKRADGPRKPTKHKDHPAARLAPDAAAAAEAEAILGLDEELAPMDEELTTTDEPAATDEAAMMAGSTPETEPTPETAMAEPETVEVMPMAEADHDTNGHVAPAAEVVEDSEAMAAWTEALASIRGLAGEESPEAPTAAVSDEPAIDSPAVAGTEDDYVDTFEAPSGSLLGFLAGANRINSPDDLSPEERIALLGFDEPAPGEEPAPMEVIPVEVVPTEAITRVVVSGLASVAEISGFKSALVAVAGVVSVSVTSGHDGEFVFSVVHATTTDLRVAVPGFGRFAPKLTVDDGAVLTFAVGDPGS